MTGKPEAGGTPASEGGPSEGNPPAHIPRKLPNLPPREKELVRGALERVRRIPLSTPDEQYVLQVLKTRKALAWHLSNPGDKRPQARRITWTGVLLSLLTAAAVVAFGLWHVSTRYETPLPGLEDPVRFLLLFGGMFLIAWLPMVIALVHARTLRRRSDEADEADPSTALSVFDTALVRGLIRAGAPQKPPETSTPGQA